MLWLGHGPGDVDLEGIQRATGRRPILRAILLCGGDVD